MLQSTFVKTEKHLTRLHTARWYTERPVSAATNRYCRFWSAKTNVAFQERPSRPDWSCILCLCECVSGCWGEEGRGGLLILSVAAAPLIPVPQRCPNFTLLCEPNYLHLPFFFPSPLVVRDFRDSIHVLRATISRTNTQTHMYRPHKAEQLEPCEWSNWDHWLRSFTSCRPKVLVMVHVNGQGACKDNK